MSMPVPHQQTPNFTRPYVLAFDIDQTLLKRGSPDQRQHFQSLVAPALLETLRNGGVLVAVTGNTEAQLCDRFLNWLLPFLSRDAATLRLLENVYLFFQLGGALASFDLGHPQLARLLQRARSGALRDHELFDAVVQTAPDGPSTILPDFIDARYVEDTAIPPAEVTIIEAIVRKAGRTFAGQLRRNLPTWRTDFRIRTLEDAADETEAVDGQLRPVFTLPVTGVGAFAPPLEVRTANVGGSNAPVRVVVQITLRHILSASHRRAGPSHEQAGDPRADLAREIQRRLHEAGLTRYAARPGGQSSIDVTKRSVDKSSALLYLLRRLGLIGDARNDEPPGKYLVWMGDEVFPQGNDWSVVAGVPGATAIALNSPDRHVPLDAMVLRPYPDVHGPEAAADFLAEFNAFARSHAHEASDRTPGSSALEPSVLRLFLARFLKERILKEVRNMTPDPAGSGSNLEQMRSLYYLVQTLLAERAAEERAGGESGLRILR